DHVRVVGLPALEGDEDLVVDLRKPVEAAPVAAGGLRHARPVALGLSRQAGKADLHPALLVRILDVGDDGDFDAKDVRVLGFRRGPRLLQHLEDVFRQVPWTPGPRTIRDFSWGLVNGARL